MFFTSLSYLLFLPLVYLAFYHTKDRFRWLTLLAASYIFYATFKAPHLLIVLALVTVISYQCGILLGRTRDVRSRRAIFWLGTVGCLMILAVMKYLPQLLTSGGRALVLPSSWLITLGVSYFIFQAISYLADVLLEIQAPERHFGYHALAMAFFPKLLQGPIERAGNLLPQLKAPYQFDYDAIRSGMLLFAWGMFKKVVMANRLTLYADTVFNDVHSFTGLPLLIGVYAYAFQIYFDFSGYTDMARGTARMFGINLMENFNHPYLATSVADFWRRWHISFSRWILDYIFKPLQLAWRDWGKAGMALALIITFFISGLWHGVAWGFIIWGLLHGIYLASSTIYRPYQKALHKRMGLEKSGALKIWQVLVTFHLVCFAWIFFRAASLGDAWYIISHIGHFPGGKLSVCLLVVGKRGLAIIAVFLAALFVTAVRPAIADRIQKMLDGRARWILYYAFVMLILILGRFGEAEFIYGRF
ncbi:MAG: MBOAT family protein [Candidatus Sumerlaeota bacterium]|nr:MBOAT family protein [Candidatus Sumerlaeota bacterium]